jgi:hypothetical protein
LRDERQFPCLSLDAAADADQLGLSLFQVPSTIRPEIAVVIASTGSCSLQTDSYWIHKPWIS